MNVFRNCATALLHPAHLVDFASYCLSRACHGGNAIRRLRSGVILSNFGSYTEYHDAPGLISGDEQLFLATYDFGDGDLIDVGANLGAVTLQLSQRFPERKVYSFEPNSSTHAALLGNISLNACGNVRAYREALSETNGEISFLVNDRQRATCRVTDGSDARSIRVPCSTLDAVCRREKISRIALLKIDVEGHEDSVLRGAKSLFQESLPNVVYYEVCRGYGKFLKKDYLEPTRFLEKYGYRIHCITRKGGLMPVMDFSLDSDGPANWVAVHERHKNIFQGSR